MDNTAGPEKKVASGGRQPGKKPAPEQASAAKSLWEVIDEVMGDLPEAVLSSLPADGSERHDHYLYGTREKKQRKS